jgi:riboflavin kinase
MRSVRAADPDAALSDARVMMAHKVRTPRAKSPGTLRSMPTLLGTVTSGQGNFSYWIGKLHDHYRRKTGLDLYPGTLNLLLAEPYSLPAKRLRLEADEYGGTVSVNLVPCRVFGRAAFLLRTDLNESGNGPHPRNLIEIATDVRLRDAHNLKDGDTVEVEILADPA